MHPQGRTKTNITSRSGRPTNFKCPDVGSDLVEYQRIIIQIQITQAILLLLKLRPILGVREQLNVYNFGKMCQCVVTAKRPFRSQINC